MKPTAAVLGWDLLAYACTALEARLRTTLRLTWRVARKPTVECIHDLRVSCRRLRAAIALLHDVPALPPLGEVDRAARRMAKSIAPIREVDAAVDRLSRAALPKDAERVRGDVVGALVRRRRALVAKRGGRVKRRAKALEKAIVARIPLVREPAGSAAVAPTETDFRAYLARRVGALEASTRARAKEAILSGQDEQKLHRVRIAVKHWGYAAEIGREAIPSAFSVGAGLRLKRLKDIGGATQDYADLRRLVNRELRRIDPKRHRAEALGESVAALQERSTAKFVAALEDFARTAR